MVLHVILYQPEIPPNTGNIIRLCANTGARLHLIHPLGFQLDNRQLCRAGLDYHDLAGLRQHGSFKEFSETIAPTRIFALSTRGGQRYDQMQYHAGDALLFGPETRGLPQDVLDGIGRDNVLRIPMLEESRSLNLANAVAVVTYEAWRQLGFATAHRPHDPVG